MASYFSEVIEKPSLISRFNGRFELLVPKDFNSKTNPDKYQEDVRRIKKFYFGDEAISRQNLERYIAVSLYSLITTRTYKYTVPKYVPEKQVLTDRITALLGIFHRPVF